MEDTDMKNWNNPVIEEVDIKDTAHNLFGLYGDGGYIGDGIISGHLTFDKPTKPTTPTTPTTPTEPAIDPQPVDPVNSHS